MPVGEEDGVGESRQISVRAAFLPAAGGAGSHSNDGRQCLGLVLVDEVEALADQGPVVLERPRFLRTAKEMEDDKVRAISTGADCCVFIRRSTGQTRKSFSRVSSVTARISIPSLTEANASIA